MDGKAHPAKEGNGDPTCFPEDAPRPICLISCPFVESRHDACDILVMALPFIVALEAALAEGSSRPWDPPHETGWSSFVAMARAMGGRVKVAEDITYERLME